MWVKPPEVLARDRLLGSYAVSDYTILSTTKSRKQDCLMQGMMICLIFSSCPLPFLLFYLNTKESAHVNWYYHLSIVTQFNQEIQRQVEGTSASWANVLLQVKPVLNRVKLTLILLATLLVSCSLLFINLGNQKDPYVLSEDAGGRAVAGVYNEESARSFEPDAFCGVPDRSWISYMRTVSYVLLVYGIRYNSRGLNTQFFLGRSTEL